MSGRIRNVLSYKTQAPRRLLLRFTVPVFVVVLAVALLLGAAWFWAAAAASMAVIGTEVAIDAGWERRKRVVPHRDK